MSYIRIEPADPVDEYIERFIDQEAVDAWNGEPRTWPWMQRPSPRPVGHSNRAIEPLSFTVTVYEPGDEPCPP